MPLWKGGKKVVPKARNYTFKIAYCTQCKPPVIVAAGPFDTALKHRTPEGTVHTTIKAMEVKEEWRVNETPDALIARMHKKYKDKLK